MQRHECNKRNYLCINDSLKFLFPCENQGVTISIAKLKPNIMSSLKVRDRIIHISISSSSNQIQGFVLILIALQLTLGCILMRCQDHIPYLYDLPNSMSLAQQVVPCLDFSITEIFTIENHKLNDTFLHVALGSQSQLWTTSDLTRSDTNRRTDVTTRGG
jgi:hypothetical protein